MWITPFVPRLPLPFTSEAPAIHHARLRRRRLRASTWREASRCPWRARHCSIARSTKAMLMGPGVWSLSRANASQDLLRLGSSSVAFQLPKCIAGGVKTDYLSVGIRVGHHRVGLTAYQARSPL